MAIYYECDFCPRDEVKKSKHSASTEGVMISSDNGTGAIICERCVNHAVLVIKDNKKRPTASDWLPWNGGECPVDGDTVVEVEFRGGLTDTGMAWGWNWQNLGNNCDIIRYRVVGETNE